MTKNKTIQTPWGDVQDIKQYRKGFYYYETASHGGYYLSKRYNNKIPAKYRNVDGWYEQDCDALIVEYFHYDITQPFSKEYIEEELENYFGVKVEDS